MDTENPSLAIIRQEIVKNHLQVTAIIQDIQQCTGPLELLNDLNAEGRIKLSNLRKSIEDLENLSDNELNVKRKNELNDEIENKKSQLSNILSSFKKANIISSCVIDKLSKDELFTTPGEQQQTILRKRRDRQALASTSTKATDRLLSISRTLAETNQRSADTLGTLILSSEKVTGTKDELEHQQQAIVQSGKLLGKYGRREVTDKALMVLAFAFFLACVFYILQKRIW